MVPRSQLEGAQTRGRLVAAAAREFAASGYDGASLRRICASAEVTTGALYFFFKNKEDLFRTVMSPIVTSMGAMLADVGGKRLAAALSGEGEAPGDVGDVLGEGPVCEFLELCREQRKLVEIMVRNRETPVMDSILSEVSMGLARSIRRRLEACAADPDVRDPFVLGWLADVTLDSVVSVLEADEAPEEVARRVRVTLGFIQGGCGALRARGGSR